MLANHSATINIGNLPDSALVMNSEIDFIFYSLEQGPFDLGTMQAFMKAPSMLQAAPVLENIPSS